MAWIFMHRKVHWMKKADALSWHGCVCPRPLADGRIGMLTFPRLVRQKEGDLRFGLHPAVERLFTRVLQKKQAEDVLRDQRPLKISLDLLEGAHIDIGGYVIRFYQEKVYTDRSKVLAIERADLFGEEAQVGKEFCTPILPGWQTS